MTRTDDPWMRKLLEGWKESCVLGERLGKCTKASRELLGAPSRDSPAAVEPYRRC